MLRENLWPPILLLHRVVLSAVFIFTLLLTLPLSATVVRTAKEKLHGEIIRIEEDHIAVQTKSGEVREIPRAEIIAIENDDGKTLWSLTNSQDYGMNTTTSKARRQNENTPWRIALTGGGGLMGSSSWFSKYPIGVRGDLDALWNTNLSLLRAIDNTSAWVVGFGFSQRNLTASGVNFDGVYGVGIWPARYVDLRAGYRATQDWLFLEGGLLQAIHVGEAPLTIDSGQKATNYSAPNADLRAYLAFYLGLGATIPLLNRLSGLVLLRYEHGIAPALTANVATQMGFSGEVVSRAPVRLIAWSMALELGIEFAME